MRTPILERLAGAWGDQVIHVFDRVWAGGPWMQVLQETGVRFIERWLVKPGKGRERRAWEIHVRQAASRSQDAAVSLTPGIEPPVADSSPNYFLFSLSKFNTIHVSSL